MESLSLRERGLKSTDVKNKLSVSAVALLARAWIEITVPSMTQQQFRSLSLRERGLKSY